MIKAFPPPRQHPVLQPSSLPDIVGTHDEELGILIEKIEELEEIVGLPGGFVFPERGFKG